MSASSTKQIVTVIGGTGFLGRSVVEALGQHCSEIRIASRTATGGSGKSQSPTIRSVPMNILDADSVMSAVRGSTYVVNLVGLLYEKGDQTFRACHTLGPKFIADAVANQPDCRLVHISSLGVGLSSPSAYARTKAEGEKEIRSICPNSSVILRPSLVVGPGEGNDFFQRFYQMARFSPMLPLVGGGSTRFQPVDVLDVAKAVANVVSGSASNVMGKTFELGGPQVLTFKQLLDKMLQRTGMHRMYMPIPFAMASLQGSIVQRVMSDPMITEDQVRLLRFDNIVGVDPTCGTIQDLGIRVPNSVDAVLKRWNV